MNSIKQNKVTQLLAIGLLLAIIKLIYSFFYFTNILDFIVFLTGGIVLGRLVPSNQRTLGLLLALPAFLLCLFFVINLGYASILNGVGTSYAISLLVVPLATGIGLFINAKFFFQKKYTKK